MSAPLEVFLPFKGGLPPLRKYLSQLYSRRQFMAAFARSELRRQNYGSAFGQVWLILNPLLLSAVYFLLIVIISGHADKARYGHLTASLFIFYLVTDAIVAGAKSITSGGRLVLNSAFPRLMLPMSAAVVSLFKFLPTLLVLVVFHALLGLPFSWTMLWAIPLIALFFLFALGCAIFFACVNVYFRDAQNLIPYLTRTLLYLSPVLYEASALKSNLQFLKNINPMYPLLDMWSRVMVHAQLPNCTSYIKRCYGLP
ncbi:MAG: ABC transporter permease [Actinobacteria bacterium]|nr:ABC transporter permease [Actinomycetota bacterium]